MRFIETLEWFGSVVQCPLEEEKAEDAERFIKPSKALSAKQRIEIYNQQYWWRLLNTLHESFPFLVRLFGYHAFNQEIAIPLLTAYPSNNWSLSFLGERIVEFLEKSQDELVINAAAIDLSYTLSFIAEEKPFKEQDFIEELGLQPHLFLFTFSHDLFKLRHNFLEHEVEYWVDHPFPEPNISKSPYFVLYRNTQNQIQVETVTEEEFLLLEKLQKGTTLDALVAASDFSLAEQLKKFAALKWIARK